jgi:Toprim-like/Protein of unknown function (DUF3991)
MKTFQEFRNDISIIEMAASVGYQVDKSKGNKWPVMISRYNDEKIIIVNPASTSNQGYFNPGNDLDKGTLIDFIRNRLGQEFRNDASFSESKNINKVLYGYQHIPMEIDEVYIKPSTASKIYKYSDDDFSPLKNTLYLTGRLISNETICGPEFKGTIFNKFQNGFANIAFPYKNEKGEIRGIEYRNQDYKMFSEGMDRSNAVWHSNMPPKLEKIALAESPIDALSYHQLKQPEHILYVAFGGSLSVNQMPIIKALAAMHPCKMDGFHFVSIADNDTQGEKYNLKLKELLMPERLVVDKPVLKDYNEDLKMAPGVHSDKSFCLKK